MTLTIVIVAFNAKADLERCLESLHVNAPALPHTVIVVDNASTDDGVAAVRRRWPGVQVLAQSANLGFARANNVGIRATTSDLVLLLNPDTIVPSGAIDTLVARLLAHPDAAVAGPRLVDPDGRIELSFGSMIGPLAEAAQKVRMALAARGGRLASAWLERMTGRERWVDWVSGACLLVHRRAAEAAGLLDERYFMYTEDVDFCAAIRAGGGRVLFTPAATIVHVRGRSRATAPAATNRAYRRSQIAFYEKHHPAWAPVLRWYLRVKGLAP